MNLEKNVALYEEMFHALSEGWAFARRPSFRRARMRWGLDLMGCSHVGNTVVRVTTASISRPTYR